jgi:hypothetical protein
MTETNRLVRSIVAGTVALSVIACGTVSPTASPGPTPTTPSSSSLPGESPPTPTPSPAPTGTIPAPLDGVVVPAELATRLPLAIMIDDNVVARPQAGFNAASIVYQAPADGGEDRYMLVFQEGDATTVGPVRSGRPYFVRWVTEYRAAFGHFGGDTKTLAYLPTINGSLLYDVNGITYGGTAYHRISSRKAPHNAYTDTVTFRRVAERLGALETMVAGLPVRPFVEDMAIADRPATASMTIPYNRGSSGYVYDRATNAYLRSVAGQPQLDAADGKRVTARNVVVLFMRLSIDPESEPGYARPVLDQIGSGQALVFREGHVWVGTWRKDDVSGLTRLIDADGKEISLVRGRIFIQVVSTNTTVKYDAVPGT